MMSTEMLESFCHFFSPILKLNGVSTETCFIAIAETLKCLFFFLLKNDIINLIKHLQRKLRILRQRLSVAFWLLISNKRSYQFSVLERQTERRRCPAHAYTQVPFTMSVISCFNIFLFFYKRTNYLIFFFFKKKQEINRK